MRTCPSTLPGSKHVKCVQEDNGLDHYLGHAGFDDRDGGASRTWSVVPRDWQRWDRV